MKIRAAFILTAAYAFSLGASPLEAQLDASLFGAMRARSIGPAGMSGRIAAVTTEPGDANVIYVGAATGGVWKSVNAGTSWEPIFDEQRLLGIGSIAVHPLNPDLVWVGTGEGNPRNSAGVGAGVYRSLDGGRTWKLMGLERSERIHRIIPDPTDPDVAFAGVLGPAWSDGAERGVYRTTDGGETWRRVLFVDERTGVSDLVMDPQNPDKLIAGMWTFRRQPWFFESGGPGSGVFVTHDGGDSWRRASEADGMPLGELGRIGLTVYEGDPRIVYALVEAERSALLRSDDGGATWEIVNDRPGVNPRPFYYTDIFVDPSNELRLYNLHSRAERSEDGGRTFETISEAVHSDFHALWIDSDDPRHLMIGTDGGVFVTHDRGDNWRMFDNLPVGQFYHVSVDMAVPFNVYGGMQDNGSWRGPSDSWDSQGIRNAHWREVAFGDGFNTLIAPDDQSFGYAMSQGGNLQRFDTRTGERKPIRPWAPEATRLRFNWNAAIATDPFQVGTIYYGSQFVHRSPDRGDTWQIISPDLTSDNPEWQRQQESGGLTLDRTGAENFTSLLTIAPSPVERGVIWSGSDDGRVHVTRAGGGTWNDVTRRIDDVPDATWVPHIEASKFVAGGAFAVFDDHRRGNWEPYVFRTDDYGRDWDRIVDEDDVDGFVHTIEQDPVARDLLFLGTEFGLYVSVDGGDRWTKWTHGMPPAPVRSLVVHPRDHDLVIGTHGRSIFVLDDIRPLRELALNPRLTRVAAHFFEPPPAYLHVSRGLDGYHFPASHLFEGETRAQGAMLSYWVGGGAPADSVRIEILDLDDRIVRTLSAPARYGLNRTTWDLREDLPAEYHFEEEPTGRGRGGFGGGSARPEVLPGTYTVRFAVGADTVRQTVEVQPDPRVDVPIVDRIAKYQATREAALMGARTRQLQQKSREIREAIEAVLQIVDERAPEAAETIRVSGDALEERLDEVADFDGVSQYRRSLRGLGASYDAPTEGERLDLQRMAEAVERLTQAINDVILLNVSAFRDQVRATGSLGFPDIDIVGRWER
jgi:photosystem II stability/assembly factor-like uncharacterized protein